MLISLYTLKVLALAEVVHRWIGVLTGLDRANRERVADYAETIAATLSRAAAALIEVARAPSAEAARCVALTELGRIAGYVETMVAVLEHHLDGRKIAGIKRRLETLAAHRLAEEVATAAPTSADVALWSARLATAEGFFRALADGLRA